MYIFLYVKRLKKIEMKKVNRRNSMKKNLITTFQMPSEYLQNYDTTKTQMNTGIKFYRAE